jgi:protocatechuate 3,4-dioxygenase, beta subunit
MFESTSHIRPRGQVQRRVASVALTAFIAMPLLVLQRRAFAQTTPNKLARRLTPSQTEGPFYPLAIPKDSDFDLLKNGALSYGKGEAAWVTGTVTDLAGKPVAGAQVEIWQADALGHYDHPRDGGKIDPAFQGFGKVVVGADGQYRFRTIKPVPYSGRAPHIHFKVKLGSRELLTSQLYVEGDSHNAKDFLWRNLPADADRAALTAPFVRGSDGLEARFGIVVAA